jgi:acetyltransferase
MEMTAPHGDPTRGPCGPALPRDAVALADGRRARLRPVRAEDLAATGRFVEALSAPSRRLRFHGAINRLPPALLRAMTDVDPCVQAVLVAEAGDEIVADARYVVGAEPGLAEFAIAVADAWQGVGLGRALMSRLIGHARARGLRSLHGEVLDHNHRMLGLMGRLGASLRTQRGALGLVRVEVVLDAPGVSAAPGVCQPAPGASGTANPSSSLHR